MADRPILFSGPMVRALLAGTKTQTRRMFKPQPEMHDAGDCTVNGHRGSVDYLMREIAPTHWLRIKVGDRLWVKETWRPFSIDIAPWDLEVVYAADGGSRVIKDGEFGENDWSFPKAAARGNVSSLFMTRWASRLTLTVTDVRVERLQDISETDALAEGITETGFTDRNEQFGVKVKDDEWCVGSSARTAYSVLWAYVNGEMDATTQSGSWFQNPWVAAYTFTVAKGNIDQLGDAA